MEERETLGRLMEEKKLTFNVERVRKIYRDIDISL